MSDLLDGTLAPREENRVGEHLEHCSACQDAYQKLKHYREVLPGLEEPSIPPDLHKRIMAGLPENAGKKPVTLVLSSWLQVSIAAAAVLILAFLVLPGKYKHAPFLEVTYSPSPEKGGKAPYSARMAEKGAPDPVVKDILDLTALPGVRLTGEQDNLVTGMTDYLDLKVARSNYPGFKKEYLAHRPFDSLPPVPAFSLSRSVSVRVYFTGRILIPGDFNADGRCDMISWYDRGREAGRLFLSLQLEKGKFSAPGVINWPEGPCYPTGKGIVAVDLNGDQADDLLVIGEGDPGTNHFLAFLNDGKGDFLPSRSIESDPALFGPLRGNYLGGDFNGDSLADLAFLYREGALAASWLIIEGGKEMSAGRSYLTTGFFQHLDSSDRFTPFVLDFNGDGYDDLGIYWQSGENTGKWMIALNNRDGSFAEAFQVYFGKSPLAFVGDYTPYAGDFTGDGLDDLLVKAGTGDEVSQWYLMENLGGEKFSLGQEVRFGEQEDMIAGKGQ